MASLLLKRLTSVSPLVPSSRRTILFPLFHFSTQIQQKDDLPFITQYLISSFGFSQDRALRLGTDKNLAGISTPDRPESVVRFLKDTGLTDIQIKLVISWAPHLLATSVSKTLEPWTREVIAAGFTRETLIHLIRYNPLVSTRTNTVSRLQFWRNFVGSEEAFLKVIKLRWVINKNLDKEIIPRINLLREYGLSDKEIATIFTKTNSFLLQSPYSIKSNFEQIEKIGFPRRSKMFLEGLVVISSVKKDRFDTKMAFFKTYGWSDEDISLALRKFPRMLLLSQENVKSTMDFFIEKVGLNPRSIASKPILLGLSLEKRLIPRHYVISVLKSKSLGDRRSFFSLIACPEKRFIEKCILPYKEELPNLDEEYAVARAGKMSLS